MTNDDLMAKMREALDKKNTKEKAHGSEVIDNAPKMHRRKAGGGGS